VSETSRRIAEILNDAARDGATLTYRQIADRAEIPPLRRIQTVTSTLEEMVRADHAAGRPLLAALAVSRAGDGLPGPGFFQLCRDLAMYFGPDNGPQARLFHEIQCRRIFDTLASS
jgi:hypothetical protein